MILSAKNGNNVKKKNEKGYLITYEEFSSSFNF